MASAIVTIMMTIEHAVVQGVRLIVWLAGRF